MVESFFWRTARAGSSHISMFSVQLTSSMPSREMWLSAAVLRIKRLAAQAHDLDAVLLDGLCGPFQRGQGALSPPIRSRMIFILLFLSAVLDGLVLFVQHRWKLATARSAWAM